MTTGNDNHRDPPGPPRATLREVRFLAEHAGRLHRVGKFAFATTDASIYLIPYAPTGRYFLGVSGVLAAGESVTFNFAEQASAEHAPKLSIHETGRVHARVGDTQVGPVLIPRLSDLRGEHVASIQVDGFATLPLHDAPPRYDGAERDLIIAEREGVEAGRLAVFVSSDEAAFRGLQGVMVRLDRPTLRRPLFVRIAPAPNPPLGEPANRGVTIIGGWDPLAADDDETQFVFIRGV